MSARSRYGSRDTPMTKRFRSPRLTTAKNHAAKPQVTYDYDAAISQPDVPNLLDRKKIGRGVTKRSQEFKIKSMVQKTAKTRSSNNKNAHQVKKTLACPDDNKHINEKENVTNNNIYEDSLSNFLRDATKETYEDKNDGNNEIVEEKIKDERTDESENVTARSLVQGKGSKIPRAKIPVVHTFHDFHPENKLHVNTNQEEVAHLETSCAVNNVDVQGKEAKKKLCAEQCSCKQDIVRFHELQNEKKIVWNKEETSTLEADEEAEDHGLTSTDESPAIISSIDDPRVLTILRNLKLNCPCKSCTEHDLPTSSRLEDDSDLKGSPPEESRRKKWSSRHRQIIDTSSEDVDESSNYNSEDTKKRKKGRNKTKSILTQRIKTNSIVHASPKISNRRQSSFSFLNTLFDIVFWPYLFLKTNR
ncbi:unnamed protein product [Xylocopa violacea]|uniref:Uncharacterized protein n=1 Tax=Xylocopa violacea TaxID=135666 RepID=A0ABP1N9I6_XYLVO